MLAVLQAFALIAVVVGVGGVVGRTGVLGDNARMVLNRTAFHVGVPALMLITLADTAPAKIFSPALLISAITALTVFGRVLRDRQPVLAPAARGVRHRRVGGFGGNAGNLGLPRSTYVFGSTTEVSSIILLQYVVLVPMILAILDSESAEPRSAGHRLRR